ncbi:hypothetical protein DICPUDRAFT_50813 [Dictyostelium purpureum]|uniref:WD repeat-containing protein 37 n=1 Tax=Dictyostelium purpureum TaxID=5786 RepID=F1A0J0_DICPU|nr:uncharacterized protein DICPUDRAFT_50813 [Dictyostelium purpureum]EGC30281.1 hypothetical protein DICPUDRAFT_50813 [Dictyostelium purpureum]|eukprot:XP_003293184.1 hypothetical protein DICPUDRAFT_50813 [Dictyostelium purpureum]
MNNKNSKDTPKLSLNNANLNNINNINQLPSFDRFKELLGKLENEYKILWLENQELKSKVELLTNNNNSNLINNQHATLNNSSNNVIVNNSNNNSNNTIANNKENQSNSPNINNNSSNTGKSTLVSIISSNKNSTNTTAINTSNISSTTSKTNNGFLISATGKTKLPKIKKSKSQSKPKQTNLSKRDGSHKWIRAKEYLGHKDGIWEITGCPWEIVYFGTASTDRTARIWTVDGSKLPMVYTAHTGTVNSIRFHPLERYFCTASGDKTIHIVKLPSERGSHGYRSPQQPSINIQQPQYTSPNQINSHNTPGSPVMGRSTNPISAPTNNIPITNIQHNIDKSKTKLWTPLLERQSNNFTTPNTMNSSGGIPINTFNITNNNNNNSNSKSNSKTNNFDNDFDMDSESSDMEQTQTPTFKPPQSPRDFKILDDHKVQPVVNTFQQQQQQHQHHHHQYHQHHHQHQHQHHHHHHHKKSTQLHTNAEQTHTFIRSPIMELKGHSSPVIGATWVSSNVIASSSWDNSIRWWNTETGRMISNSNICSDLLYRVTNITSQPLASNQCVTSSTDGIVRIWDFRSSVSGCVDSIQASPESINSAIFTHDGISIISGGEDRSVKVWDIRQSKSYKTSIRCPFGINRLSVSSHGSIAIPQDDGRISVYDVNGNRKGKMRDQYKYGHKLMGTSTSWSFDDSVIYSAGIDRKAISWAENS